jgi:asparagine synthase (glutamine-hydrolysing)
MNGVAGSILGPGAARADGARLVAAMAARVPGAAEPAPLVAGGLAAFATGSGRVVELPGGVVLAADLDLVNADELAGEADRDPMRVIAALYTREGLAGMRRLRGGFAVAIWDPRERRLHLAVDHHGIKRLFYARGAHGLAFASRAVALLAVPGVSGAVDPTAVYHQLNFGFVPAPGSIFAGVHRLPPGHELSGPVDRPAVAAYWEPVFAEGWMAPEAAAAETYRLAQEAVERCARGASAKEAGAFLSGGTDSSTVVGLMGKASGERVNAFSVGFQEPRYDEMSYAELAAKHFGAAHYTVVVGADRAVAAIPGLVEGYDEPFANSSALGTYFCARLARECGVTRMLAGDGGDEIFGGNARYVEQKVLGFYELLPQALRRSVCESLLLRLPSGWLPPLRKVQSYVRQAREPLPDRLERWNYFTRTAAAEILTPEFLAKVDTRAPLELLRSVYRRAPDASPLNRMLMLDWKQTLADNDLRKVNRTAALAGVDVEYPFLDPAVVELSTRVPSRLKIRGLTLRAFYKDAMRDFLPREILRKSKHGFGLPFGLWLRDHAPLRELVFDSLATLRRRGIVRGSYLDGLRDQHAQEHAAYYGEFIWILAVLELWLQRYAGRYSLT